MSINIKVYKDVNDIGKAAAVMFASQVIEKPNSVLGLATGSTPIPTYKSIISLYESGIVDFSKVTTFNLDEYIGLGHAHEQSYYYFMQHNLFYGINVPKENINVPSGTESDIISAGKEYDKKIEKAGGIDLQILGIGINGHIAFNEPCSVFPMGTHGVNLTKSTIEANARFFKNASEVPHQAISMGIGSIMKAKKIIIIATGENKADAVSAMVSGPVRPSVPASILQMHKNVTLFCDEAAASKL